MTNDQRPTIPTGDDTYSDADWETATERVNATRKQVLADNPEAAVAEAAAYDAIARRVHTLAAIRKARGLTQEQISDELGISQAEISRMERRTNLHLETLARFIRAAGGRLRITAVFDDNEMEVGIGDIAQRASGLPNGTNTTSGDPADFDPEAMASTAAQ